MMDKDNFISRGVCLMYCLVLLIKGCHGFYIKHSGTGLCLKPTNNYFDIGFWGQQYYVEFYDNCLHSDAQFRYVDKEFVVNIGKNGTLIARVKTRYQNRFIVYHPKDQATQAFLRTSDHTLKQTASGSLITYQGTHCAIPKTLTTPSKGDQLIRTTLCGTKLQKFTFGSVTSHGATMIDVSCASTQKMQVVMAEYGAFMKGTFDKDNDADCSLPVACKVVKKLCDGNSSCAITVDSSLFPFSQCPRRSKQLHMEYRCVDNLGIPITSVSKVRLSQQPNQGFIEVLDGATWRKVIDENWDKRKQGALCHHLGLYNESNVTETKNISTGQDLASGALYCQGTQPGDQSCCAYLYPSTSTSRSRIPFVKCKICDEPLLQNNTRFPNGVFSASVANGHDARLSNNGWCSTSSGNPYLQIDLQKDYHISHVATFGDKNQTKWVTSFLLQYSRTVSGLGSGARERTITANNDAYQASITKLDNVYGRYLKIIPKSGNNFCIRVEVCGQVYVDLSPSDLKALALSSTSLSISWKQPNLPEKVKLSSYYICYKHTKETCTSTQSSSHIILNGLRQGTKYVVRVRSETTAGKSEFRIISKFTNDVPAEIPTTTYHSFDIKLLRSTESFKYLQIIVQVANSSQHPPDQYLTKDLKSYHDRTTSSDPYITVELQSSKISSNIFTVGDGKWYNSKNSSYYNRLLEEKKSYFVFARFFESKITYYSTYWSSAIKLPTRPPAPNIAKIVSYGRNGLKITWTQPSLPEDQTALNHIVSYWTSSNSATKETGSGSSSYIFEGVAYKTKYFISVQIETQAGRSEASHELSITTNSEPLSPQKKSDNSYTITLRKPKDKATKRVQLIILQLQFTSTIPKPSEEVQPVAFCAVNKEADNIAFIAKKFNINDFNGNTIDVTLQLSDDERRRRRASESNVVKGLVPNVTYRSSQWNYNAFGVSTKSYWSEPFDFHAESRETSGKVASELCKECSKTSLYIIISMLLVIIAVLIVVVIYLYMRLRKRQPPPAKDKVVVDIHNNEAFSDDIYEAVEFPPSTCELNVEENTTNTYDELNLTDKNQDEYANQSLAKNPIAEN